MSSKNKNPGALAGAAGAMLSKTFGTSDNSTDTPSRNPISAGTAEDTLGPIIALHWLGIVPFGEAMA